LVTNSLGWVALGEFLNLLELGVGQVDGYVGPSALHVHVERVDVTYT
jgi:hypothetical protein